MNLHRSTVTLKLLSRGAAAGAKVSLAVLMNR
jgi:hypothetical protein